MGRFVLAIVLLGCKARHEDIPAPPTSNGSALISMQAIDAGGQVAKPLAARYAECIELANAAKWDDFKGCYTPQTKFEQPGLGDPHSLGEELGERKNARIAFPDEHHDTQLIMVAGNTVVAIETIKATNSKSLTGPTSTIEATNKRAGILLGQVVTFDETGRGTSDAAYFDVTTIVTQMGKSKALARSPDLKPWSPKVTVVASFDAREQANAKTIADYAAAFTKHDAKAVGALLADTVVWSEQPIDTDFDKPATLGHFAALWAGFSDLKLAHANTWAAGEYVAAAGTLEGTNDGELAGSAKTGKRVTIPILGVYKLADGKIVAAWLFWQRQGLSAQLR
ncbi:MAG: ester cyclase [Kofleriaceae bacterium]